MPQEAELHRRMESIENLVQQIEALPDVKSRDLCKHLVQSVMDLNSAGFSRVIEILSGTSKSGHAALEELGRDELVCSLLALYGIHPVDFETRVREVVSSHGDVELTGITGSGAVTVRLRQNSGGCGSSSASLQSSIEQAIYKAAPEVTEIIVENPAGASQFIPLDSLVGEFTAT
jgi:Fe-S cluster biogenesis protein NfuA